MVVPGDTNKDASGNYASKGAAAHKTVDCWYYPEDLANDLSTVNLPLRTKEEIFACAWEYSRCVIPQYTNWNRYVAFMRTIVIGIVAEFAGRMVDIAAGDENVLGYNLTSVLNDLFEGTPGHAAMSRDYRSFLLVTADKSSDRKDGELFRRYVNALAQSPRQWFRMRDADSLARFTIASALACNDLNTWFTDEQFEILAEIGSTLYDAVAFYKHRAEGETNSTFAYVHTQPNLPIPFVSRFKGMIHELTPRAITSYMPADERIAAFRQCRELLWALDTAWAKQAGLACVTNFLRLFGGPIHMMMRRYRFIEEGLTIGQPETEEVVVQTRQHHKLWNRVAADESPGGQDMARYRMLMGKSDALMFAGLAEWLSAADAPKTSCSHCKSKPFYGTTHRHEFGGVQLCETCQEDWRRYSQSISLRTTQAFPELATVLKPRPP